MERLTPVRLITEDLPCEAQSDPSQFQRLSSIHVPRGKLIPSPGSDGEVSLNGPVLQAIEGPSLRPWFIRVDAPKRVGYTFFEKTALSKDDVAAAVGYFDMVVAGSAWCEGILRARGVNSTATIIQGIDPLHFHPGYSAKVRHKERFVVFSGGKLELRKGQDIVIRAFKALQDRHEDVLLVNAWYNLWDGSTRTMTMSPYIRFDMPEGDYFRAVNRLLLANGVDPEKVVTLPPIPHERMAEIYRDSDCGLFPNRCEGGTNLVLMEYMACGKPAIASYRTGHRDVVNADNAILLRAYGKIRIQNDRGEVLQEWDDPNIDEVIARLEWAYQNRDSIQEIGRKAGESMQSNTWEKSARKFLDILQ
jgi:glycosyltransferase involved in cell wall biosynthesis